MFGYLLWLIIGVWLGVLGMRYIYRGFLISHRHEGALKHSRKRRIIHMFDHKERVTVRDVMHAFHVTERTAEHYLDELEEDGRVGKVGGHGGHVYYERA
jgi:hypothetical protein